MYHRMTEGQWHQIDQFHLTKNYASASIFTGQMLYLASNQRCQRTESNLIMPESGPDIEARFWSPTSACLVGVWYVNMVVT